MLFCVQTPVQIGHMKYFYVNLIDGSYYSTSTQVLVLHYNGDNLSDPAARKWTFICLEFGTLADSDQVKFMWLMKRNGIVG